MTNGNNMNICAEVRYILTGDENIITTHYFCFFRKEAVNVDSLYDDWETGGQGRGLFNEYIDELFWNWYNKTTEYNRSYVFYHFIQDFKWQFDEKIRNSVDNKGVISILKKNRLFSFLEKFVLLANKFSKSVYYTFNELMKIEYVGRQERWGQTFLTDLTRSNSFNGVGTIRSTQPTYLNDTINVQTTDANLNNLNNSIVRVLGDNIIYNNRVYNRTNYGTSQPLTSTSSTFTINQTTSTNTYTTDTFLSEDQIARLKRSQKIDYRKLKVERKKLRSVLKKSIGVLQRFIGLDKLLRFLKGEGFIIEAKRFNYRLTLPNHKSLIDGTRNIDHYSIKYDLEILSKENVKICNVCTIFQGSPILDQVLSAYMFLVAGEEEEFLKNCNFIRREDNFYEFFPELKKDNHLELQTNVLSVINSVTIDFHNRNQKFNKLRSLSREYIGRHFSEEIVDYLFTTDVSWGEAIDYVAFNIFNVTAFDRYVQTKQNSKYLVHRNNINKNIKRITLESRKKSERGNNFLKLLRGRNNNLGGKRYKSYRGENCRAVSKRSSILFS